MAQYIPFDEKVEVNGETVLSVANAFPEHARFLGLKILEKNGLKNPVPGMWYSQKKWLNAFEEIGKAFGTSTLFEIGKAIPANAKFPENILNLKNALEILDIAYHLNHRNGEIGYYRLINYDEVERVASMECKNPYPCHFDRGIITSLARKFAPLGSYMISVDLDYSKTSRLDGSDTSWYFVKW